MRRDRVFSVRTPLLLLAAMCADTTYGQRRLFDAPMTSRGYVAVSPNGKLLAARGTFDSKIRLWDLGSDKLLRSIEAHFNGVARLAFSPDGKTFASAGWGDPAVRIWDSATCNLLQTLGKAPSAVCFVAYSPDGKALASGFDGDVAVWDLKSGKERFQLKCTNFVDSVAISPDSCLLAAAQGDGTVALWDLGSAKLVRTLPCS